METSTQCTARLRKDAISLRLVHAKEEWPNLIHQAFCRRGPHRASAPTWNYQQGTRVLGDTIRTSVIHCPRQRQSIPFVEGWRRLGCNRHDSEVQFESPVPILDKSGQSVHPHAFHLNHESHSHGVHETLPCVSLPAVNETGARPVRLDWPPAESRHRTNSANNPPTAITVPAVAPLLCASPTRGRRLACGRFTHTHAHRATALIRIRISSRSGAPPRTVSPTKTPPPINEWFPRL